MLQDAVNGYKNHSLQMTSLSLKYSRILIEKCQENNGILLKKLAICILKYNNQNE